MSWEGYYQNICVNGHQVDDYSDDIFDVKCHVCSGKIHWFNVVDQTNGVEAGTIRDFSPVLLTPEKVEVCNLGHKHVTEPATYRVPQQNELERWYKNWEKNYEWEKLPPEE